MSIRLIQDLHAAISRRDWSATENAANRLRDDIEAARKHMAGTQIGSLPNDYPLAKLAYDVIETGPTIRFNGTGEDALRQIAIAEAEQAKKLTDKLSKAAENYVSEGGFEHSGGIIEAAFEAGALWASLAPTTPPALSE